MKAKIRLFAMALLSMVSTAMGFAQTSSTTTTWQGSDPVTLTGTSDSENNTPFLLYNVGTGKFIMTGGEWGIEAMLTLQDYGMPFTMYTQRYTLNSVANTQHVIAASVRTEKDAFAFGCNKYMWTAGNKTNQVMNAILDTRPSGSFGNTYNYYTDWDFVRVETDANASTHTYYLKETVTLVNGSNTSYGYFYVGAVHGNNENGHDNDASRTAYWYTEDGTNIPAEVQNNSNYQWRFVSREDFHSAQTSTDPNAFGGMNANVTYLLEDPYFSRNLTTFSTNWKVSTAESTKTATDGLREDWTHGSIANSDFTSTDANVTHSTIANYLWNESWNQAVFRKLQPVASQRWTDALQMQYARYMMATLEGIGSAYQTIEAPQDGSYQLEAIGYSSNSSAPGYLFVADENGNPITSVALPTVTEPQTLYSQSTTESSGSYAVTPNDYPEWINAARHLDGNTSAYTVSLVFNAEQGKKYRVGVMKNKAVKSQQSSANGSNNFYFDTSYAAVDNFQLHYLGTDAPFVLNDNTTSADYIKNTADFTNRTIYLNWHPKRNQWQSIVLPITISTEVFRQAFGEDAKLGELDGVGKAEGSSPQSIDFKSVDISKSQDAIKAGNFYLIYATREPEQIEYTNNNKPVSGNLYRIGRHSMTGNSSFNTTVSQEIANSSYSGTTGTPFTSGNLTATGTYIKTPTEMSSNFAPEHSYFVQNGDMFYLRKNTRVYGFQWWITATGEAAKNGLSFNIIDPSKDNTATYISGISIDRKATDGNDNAVYNIAGQRVADNVSELSRLPKGIYITGGRKIFNR